jgi:telomere resolvase
MPPAPPEAGSSFSGISVMDQDVSVLEGNFHALGIGHEPWKPGYLRSAYAAICCHRFKPRNQTDDIFLAQILGHKLLGPNAASPSGRVIRISTSKVSCFLTKNPSIRGEEAADHPSRQRKALRRRKLVPTGLDRLRTQPNSLNNAPLERLLQLLTL